MKLKFVCESDFVFDTAEISIQPYDRENNWFPLSVRLIKNGKPITVPAAYFAFISQVGYKFPVDHNVHQFDDARSDSTVTGPIDCGGGMRSYFVQYFPDDTPNLVISGQAGGSYRMNIVLPSGGIVSSGSMTWEMPIPPV